MTDNITTTVISSDSISNIVSAPALSSLNDYTTATWTVGDAYVDTGTVTTNRTTVTTDNWGTITVSPYTAVDSSWTYSPKIDYDEILKKLEEKENNKMANDFSFGPYTGNAIKLSPYGIAIKNKAGKWVSYNRDRGRIMDVDIFNIDIDTSKVFYKIPRAISAVCPGDVILHNGTPVFVEEVNNGRFTVINPYEGTEITILPAQSPFGFDYIPVIISLTDCLPEADENNPFGSLLPFLLMDKDNNNMALMLALSGNTKNLDPMMLMALSGGDMSGYFLM